MAQAEALDELNRFYQEVDRTHEALFHWQYVALENGLVATFPGHGNYPEDFDVREREWYQAQKLKRDFGPPLWRARFFQQDLSFLGLKKLTTDRSKSE